jgi:hypothetical protein
MNMNVPHEDRMPDGSRYRGGWCARLMAGTLAGGSALLLLGGALPATARAQESGKLVGATSSDVGVVYESWSFGSDGIAQPGVDAGATSRVSSASQLSVPISVRVPLGERWTVDASGAFASGTVKLSEPDPVTGTDKYTLSGLTDVRLRATGRVVGDNLLLTFGVNVPSGKTKLDRSEFAALRVLAAPALSFQSPVLGTGTSATLGMVYARQVAGWAWALGGSYEMSRSYAPVALVAGLPAPDFSPGNTIHLSLGGDGLIGQHEMLVGVSADFFGRGELDGVSGGVGGAGVEIAPARTKLGPILTLDWQLRLAARSFRELTLYAVDRYRSSFEREGARVDGSSGNYLDAGVRGVYAATPSTGVLVALNLRHQTGLSVDNTLATAAVRSGALTLGIVRDLPRGYTLRPFVRGQLGKIESGDVSTTATGIAGGVALGVRF